MVDSANRLYYVPGFYNGKIYVFKEDKLDKILLSKHEFKKPYEYKFTRKSSSKPILFEWHLIYWKEFPEIYEFVLKKQ